MDNANNTLIEEIHKIISAFQKLSDKNWLRTQEAAEYLGVSVTQIHNLKRNGTLPFSKLGGTIYFKRQDIDDILEANMIGG